MIGLNYDTSPKVCFSCMLYGPDPLVFVSRYQLVEGFVQKYSTLKRKLKKVFHAQVFPRETVTIQ